MITATLSVLEGHRTPENGDLYEAKCRFGGLTYSATSRKSAAHALCRTIAPIMKADWPMKVIGPDGTHRFTISSIQWAATKTYVEGANVRLRMVAFKEMMELD